MRIFSFLIVTFLLSFANTLYAAKPDSVDPILLQLPESVIAAATQAVMPLKIDASSKSLQGDITIVSIKDLQLTKGQLSCSLQLAGKNLRFLTEIAGHEIKLKVGNVQIGFRTDAEVRYDKKSRTLFLRPMVKDVTGSGDGQNGEIGKALLALLNGREFPVTLQDIEPILAKSGTRIITIQPHIDDIQAKQDRLELKLVPEISAK